MILQYSKKLEGFIIKWNASYVYFVFVPVSCKGGIYRRLHAQDLQVITLLQVEHVQDIVTYIV